MPTLWKMPEKYKAMLVLAHKVAHSVYTLTAALVKIFDDSELTLEEAVAFGGGTVPAVVGEWRGVNSPNASET